MFDTVWYDNLIKPELNPPEWIFTPVWIILYLTILIALILYAIKITDKNKLSGYVTFITHMIFNLLWSPVFFILHKMGIALFIIIFMDFSAIILIKSFCKISKLAGSILIPYLTWILFATYLNYRLVVLN